MVTFRVDDVTPASAPLPSQPLYSLNPDALAIGGDPDQLVLAPDGVHPLLSAVARAFADHRPLVLSPDAVWLTIAQGIAQHVRLHSEELRPLLVSHSGRKRLTVTIDGPVPGDAEPWMHLVDAFSKELAAEVSHADVFECDFSTSTGIERAASRIVLLDAYSPYFAYWLVGICGIPSITLTGTVADWQKIRDRVEAIAGFGLEQWCASLAPIMSQFARAAAGDVDIEFWKRIYNPADAYGGEVITGWAARFYPYLQEDGVLEASNPLLRLRLGEPRDVTTDGESYTGPAIRSDSVPAILSKVVVNINDQVTGDNRTVALHAGLVAVAQDADGSLAPIAGWHLTAASIDIDDVIDRIERDHSALPPQPRFHVSGSSEVIAIYRRIGSARLFSGRWHLLPQTEQCAASLGRLSVRTIIAIGDGRSIAELADHRTGSVRWIVCQVQEKEMNGPIKVYPVPGRVPDDPEQIPVYGTSLAMLLESALDNDGDFSHLQTGTVGSSTD